MLFSFIRYYTECEKLWKSYLKKGWLVIRLTQYGLVLHSVDAIVLFNDTFFSSVWYKNEKSPSKLYSSTSWFSAVQTMPLSITWEGFVLAAFLFLWYCIFLVASLKKDKDKFNKEVRNLKSSVEAAIKQVKVSSRIFLCVCILLGNLGIDNNLKLVSLERKFYIRNQIVHSFRIP